MKSRSESREATLSSLVGRNIKEAAESLGMNVHALRTALYSSKKEDYYVKDGVICKVNLIHLPENRTESPQHISDVKYKPPTIIARTSAEEKERNFQEYLNAFPPTRPPIGAVKRRPFKKSPPCT